jgi:membrane-associated phospholipid phosphatase
VAAVTGTPFVLWLRDTHKLLLLIFIHISVLGVVWDGSLILLGLVTEALWRFIPLEFAPPITVKSVRKIGFFTCGMWPLIMILATSIAIFDTSNITLISLNLLGTLTKWNDPFFWQLESSIIEWVVSMPIDVVSWDRLYHSVWVIEYTVVFFLILISREPKLVLHYCISMIFLFYVGRYLGLLNPVMGPAIFKPEFFGYLSGSYTETAMQLVGSVMKMDLEEAKSASGILLGGVSAMPSLHVGMVSITAYWLGVAKRWMLFFSIPWVLMVWTSTVVLGWHYILDGAGGVGLAAVCVWATYRLLGALDMKIQQSAEAELIPEPTLQGLPLSQ